MTLIKLIKTGIVALIISLFIGFTIIVAAVGAFVPSIYKISAPVLCQGKITIESRSYSYRPGQVGVQHKVYCDRRGGEIREDITLSSALTSGIIYSLLIFPFFWIGVFLISRKVNIRELRARNQRVVYTKPRQINLAFKDTSKSTPQRMVELKNLREKGLITEEEYQAKRKEILREL